MARLFVRQDVFLKEAFEKMGGGGEVSQLTQNDEGVNKSNYIHL
jgi:hypothetical protein